MCDDCCHGSAHILGRFIIPVFCIFNRAQISFSSSSFNERVHTPIWRPVLDDPFQMALFSRVRRENGSQFRLDH